MAEQWFQISTHAGAELIRVQLDCEWSKSPHVRRLNDGLGPPACAQDQISTRVWAERVHPTKH